ncbi:alpha/beta hydrolase family esterase [Nocardia sp. NPDC088792]|uniref:alpha/beta hydrolase family esterase n=1 Tax=Nocardia sp. NPDC088792 TaxID=3364332 RepID=UPI0037F99ACC
MTTQLSYDYQRRRSYELVRPHVVVPGAPLVLVLHGFGDTPNAMRRYSGGSFDRYAERGIVVAYPNGIGREWNSARRAVMRSRSVKQIDDVGFLRALAGHLIDTWSLDPQRVFVVGFSLGGQMAIRLVCDAPGLLAGAALISSTLPAPENLVCSGGASVAVPVVTFHGTADPLAPWGGGTVGLRCSPRQRRVWFGKGPHLSAPATGRWFAERNGIEGAGTFEWIRTVAGWVGRTDYRAPGCEPVTGYTLVGGKHEIPGTRWRRLLPDTTVGGGLVASDVIAEFFGIGSETASSGTTD